ncbi:TcfC E-set like domain-containing protein [Stenotrophomonas sp. CFBP 13725]|uniref:TcfC E-set like domain-containing protein n=1 Tax=Stenotrophomonas sp. CFBP 13725 TaxID=2775297 RepID=UPI0020173166|nr:TcfC E-set like domain-containing protein [Stenotrophomonas sp. CFBP 13725]
MRTIHRLNGLAAATLCLLATMAAVPAHASADGGLGTLLHQRERMPAEFREHLFGTPLTVRVELDGTYLGNADVVLGEDNSVQLIGFVESHDSELPASDRARWSALLADPVPLGLRGSSSQGVAAVHYNLENSLLSLISSEGQRATVDGRYLLQPEGGSTGLVLRNSLNFSGGQQQDSALRYNADLQGSLGQWTTLGSYQYYHSSANSRASGHYLSALYAQREFRDNFLRVGYFLPSFEGATRQPRAPGTANYTSLGIMLGSSDALLADNGSASVYPIYVTASREGVVEIYRDGRLINVQPVKPGMQQVDTRRLPGGIYDVELRVVADGQTLSSESAAIHKPNSWSDPSRRWRYSVFAGQQAGLLDSGGDQQDGKLAAGAVVNYLLHPRAVVGATVQQVGERRSAGVSLDWQASDRFNLYTNLYDSTDAGRGMDVQGMFRLGSGSIVASHARTWVEQRDRMPPGDGQPSRWETRSGWQDSSSVSFSQRIGSRDDLTVRVGQSNGFNAGTSWDASWNRRQPLFGNNASWRVSLYDRPSGTFATQRRDRGIDFSLSLSLGNDKRNYSGNLGSRNTQGGIGDLYAGVGVQQELDAAWLKSVTASAGFDRSGVSVATGGYFDQQQLQGNVQLQRSAANGEVSGSANLESTLALGGGKVALLGTTQASGSGAGMIVDVRSDFADLQLRADDSRGGGTVLKPGRNFVPVTAYRPGQVQFDFSGATAPAAAIHPATVSYHLNRGGVMHAQIDVLRTFTVMGQVLDADGNGARGVQVINHAGRSVSQEEGFFTVELSSREPVVELRHPDQSRCMLRLDEARYPREGDVLMVGGLQCPVQVAGS